MKLTDATTGTAALEVLSRRWYYTHHDGKPCPPDALLTPERLGAWAPNTPAPAVRKARAALCALLGDGSEWVAEQGELLGCGPIRRELVPAPDGRLPTWRVTQPVLLLDAVCVAWCAADPRPPEHPAAPLVDAWQRWKAKQPPEVPPETRADRRIMPVLRVVGPAPERERGRLFGGLVDDRREADLPLFPELAPHRLRVPLLEIVDASGVPVRSRGRGAPIEARLIVRGGLLMVRPEDRGRESVRIAVTVGELLDGLYPVADTRGRRRTAQHWPKIEAALRRARDFTVTDATGGRWFPMALRRLPAAGGLPALDDLVVIDLAPVPGAATGATVHLPELDRMGLRSGPAWYSYLAGRSLVWTPGKTRRPAPGGRYGWSSDPADYPVLTLADLRRFAFGERDTGARSKAAIVAPWQGLPDLVIVPDQTDARTGIRGWRLLPAEAAAAVRKLVDSADTTLKPADTTLKLADTTLKPADTTLKSYPPEKADWTA